MIQNFWQFDEQFFLKRLPFSELKTVINDLTKNQESKMKKTYNTPKLNVHGSVEQLTQKTIGKNDGTILTIPGLTPPGGAPIGS